MKWLDRAEVQAWWALSASDLRVARVVLDLQPPEWHVACFHAQQAAEKALKALLEAHELPVPRTHDLALLVQRLHALGPTGEVAEPAIRLSIHGVGPRYPGPSGEATETDARVAVADATAIRAWAEGLLTGTNADNG